MDKFSKNLRLGQILIKFEINGQIFEKLSNMLDFNEIWN